MADPSENPARSSIAGALVNAGIPAVVASQFSLPDNSAHFLAATIYNTLLTGRPIGDAIRDGRNVMCFGERATYLDWGIPVLFSTDPSQIILARDVSVPSWSSKFSTAAENSELLDLMATNEIPMGPSLVAERSSPEHRKNSKYKIAIIDIDAKVGFLPDLAQESNRVQDYYDFQVCYMPIPSGYARTDISDSAQTFVPRLSHVFSSTPQKFSVDHVFCLTRNLVATDETGNLLYNYFALSLPGTDDVSVVSTFDLREYARKADVTFERAVLGLCISMLLQADPKLRLQPHRETVGCPLDFCQNRDDIVRSLGKTNLDHIACRKKVIDKSQLAAIDALLSIKGNFQ